jgi:hypothetical protein
LTAALPDFFSLLAQTIRPANVVALCKRNFLPLARPVREE